MNDFFKYLTTSEEDKNWGIYLNVAGKATVIPNTIYPSSEHPTGYYFTWKKGRILQEYQLIYITEGSGILEVEQEQFTIEAGTILLIRSNEHHRYRPNLQTGWVEYFVGFNGPVVQHFFQQATFLKTSAYLHVGLKESILENFLQLIKLIREEKPGFQQVASGVLIQLLGNMIAHQKHGEFVGKSIELVIQKVIVEMREHVEVHINLQELANKYNVSYSNFRKMFKKYTGISPRQYHLELKLLRAKELLLTSSKSIQEISQELQFESIHYFSRYFKKKMGVSPSQFRKTIA